MRGAERSEITLGEDLYPSSLLDLPDPPKRLYVRGDPAALGLRSLAVIGSRRVTPYGLAGAELAARIAVESGLVVVSGGAYGCDQAGGWAALEAGGKHVMVLGTGADVAYPKDVEPLMERTLSTGGAVVSLERWGASPRRYAFPKRNRVIAALAGALLISEAGMPSGTFSTAEVADQLGREVLVIPGSILSRESRGSNYLISSGATCIADEEALEESISRIFGTLRSTAASRGGSIELCDKERRVLAALTASPMRTEAIARDLGTDILETMKTLGAMEVRGLVEQLMDGRFSPTKMALHAQTSFGQNMTLK